MIKRKCCSCRNTWECNGTCRGMYRVDNVCYCWTCIAESHEYDIKEILRFREDNFRIVKVSTFEDVIKECYPKQTVSIIKEIIVNTL